MGGKSHADNDKIVEEEKRQAEEAARKEAERQARIDTGLKKIGYAFEGKPVYKDVAHDFDWKTFNDKSVLPKGYKRVQIGADGKVLPDIPGQAATPGGFRHDINAGQPGVGGRPGTATLVPARAATAAHPSSQGTTAIMGPDGKIYKAGKAFQYTTKKDTGKTRGGFTDEWFDDYNKSITDYYGADIADQYSNATDQSTYSLYRAGLGRSGAANTVTADLAKQNADNLAAIGVKADLAEAGKRADVADAKTKATNQLYATENPEVAVNQALAAVDNLSLAGPDLSPLAELFKMAAIGGSNIMSNANNAGFIGNFQGGLPKHTGSGHIEDNA